MNTIIQVVQHLRPGGIESLALDLCNFNQADEDVLIVSLEGERSSALAAWPKLQPLRNKLIFLDKPAKLSFHTVAQLVRLFKDKSAQAIHTHHIGPLLYAGLAARMAGIKHLVHTEHDAWHLHQFKHRLLQRWAIRILRPVMVADAQTVANNTQAQLQCKTPIKVIHNGIDSEYFRPGNQLLARSKLNLPTNAQIIGCSGRMEEVKGQAILIRALQQLPLEVHLAFAGSGSTETKLIQLSAQLGLAERVHFLGHRDDMPSFYQALDLFCLPSLNEGYPLSPLEAQACNIMTLVTDVGGAKETLCPNSGQFIPANDHLAMAKALGNMLCNRHNHQPRKYVQQHGDIRVMAKAYAHLRTPLAKGA